MSVRDATCAWVRAAEVERENNRTSLVKDGCGQAGKRREETKDGDEREAEDDRVEALSVGNNEVLNARCTDVSHALHVVVRTTTCAKGDVQATKGQVARGG